MHLPMKTLVLFGIGMAIAACSDGISYIEVTVTSGVALAVDRLDVTVSNAGQTVSVPFTPAMPFALPPPQTFSIQFAQDRHGDVTIDVRASKGGAEVAHASTQTTIGAGNTVQALLTFLSSDAGDMASANDMSPTNDMAMCTMNGQCIGALQCCNSKCTNTFQDVMNCGSCNAACAMPKYNACCGGCTNTTWDPQNCGDCFKSCNIQQACCGGGCIDPFTDVNNCGSCGHVCVEGICNGGICGRIPCGQPGYKCVFVSATPLSGNLGSVLGQDDNCQTYADVFKIKGTYKAWLSDTTTSPSARFIQSSVPYKRLDGVTIANNWAALASTLLAPLDPGTLPANTENGQQPSDKVWTNTAPDGTASSKSATCSNFSSNTPGSSAGVGDVSVVSSAWTAGNSLDCSTYHSLYCFEQ